MPSRSVSVLSKSYVFDPRPRLSFRIAAKRYWIEECLDAIGRDIYSGPREDTLTPIFIHGSGTHKEHWEPTIQRLFENQQAAASGSVWFHDMWSLDMPNHGDSAILNEDVLRWGYKIFPWEHHARGVHAFLAGLGTGVDVNFSKRRLVLVGHSMGACVAILATRYIPILEISSLHLMEPYVLGEKGQDWNLHLSETVGRRRDIWPSSAEAYRALKARAKLRTWDERIIKIFVEHGLRPLPTAEYPNLKGVTLKGTKKQEAAQLRDYVSFGVAYRYLPHMLKQLPTHITYGTIGDLIPCDWQEELLHVASGGVSNFASVTIVPGAEHMILQTLPDVIADIIWKSLTQQSCIRLPIDTVAAKL